MIGVIIGLVLQAVRFSHLRITYDEIDPQRLHEEIEDLPDDGLVCYINGPIVFANTERLEEIPKKAKRYGYVYFQCAACRILTSAACRNLPKLCRK